MELFREFGVVNAEGKMKLYNLEQFHQRVKQIKGTNIEIVVYKREGSISHAQRKYYFGVIIPELQRAFHFSGQDLSKQEIDDYLRLRFLYTERRDAEKDVMIREKKSLSDDAAQVSIREFQQYIEKIILFAITDLDWALPYPEEIFSTEDFTKSQILSLQKK